MTALMDITSPATGGRPRKGVGGRWGWLLLPAVALLAVLFLVPLGLMAWRSITEPTPGAGNYSWFFTSDVALATLIRTLAVGAVVTLVTLVFSYPYAYLMTVVGARARIWLTLLVLLPFWTSLMVRTFAWVVLLQDNGVVNQLLGTVGLGPLQLIRTTTGVVIGMSQVLMPFMVLPLYAVMSGIDRRLLDAAQGMGARPATAFLRVFVPLSLPGVGAGALTVFITSLGFYITPALLGSPDQALISQQIFTQVNGLLAWGRGGAMGVVLLAVTLVLLGLVGIVLRFTRTRGGAR
ncbi:ABC transporter permease [Streptomyces sp. 110]|uniref:ABC transporter permease n=1 Tax=Streptomyces endocoffeicus TaxID=2898945 RepID=A0ABS1Q0Q9_9ACTN|nr:ABC transporter permease [Streptomyces endocoffeicus]MBL1118184.1 ABC transporter permease [Streptomyces endocoffeicus]